MKVRDLVIFTFPNGADAEVTGGGKALYAKYVRKHIPPVVEKEKQPVQATQEGSAAGRVWLFEVEHSKEAATPKLLVSTDPFDGGGLRAETGIYLVFHASQNVPNLFGVKSLNAGQGAKESALENWEENQRVQARKMVELFNTLKIPKTVQRICLVACDTVQSTAAKNKAFLESFVIELDLNGYHPKVAGWDIPIEVITKEDDANYGRKRATGADTSLLKDVREKHKFVYVYRSEDRTFEMKQGDVAKKLDGNVEKQIKDLKKHTQTVVDSTLSREVLVGDPNDKKKQTIQIKAKFVQRTKYSPAGWSG